MLTAIDRLESFATRVRYGLQDADWATRREIMRSLIRKAEVGYEAIRIEYNFGPLPFDQGPDGTDTRDCGRAGRAPINVAKHSLIPDVVISRTLRRPNTA